MTRHRPSIGLVGQVVAILLLAVLIEFGVSTLLYERAAEFSVRDDEARRLAEHLVIARRLVEEQAPAQRAAMAADLTTDRYDVHWDDSLAPPPPAAPALDQMRRQVADWEPGLRLGDLRMRPSSPGISSKVTGGLRMSDGSWLHFRTLEPVAKRDLPLERIALAMVPAIALMVIGGLMLRRTLFPLRRLAAAADRVGHGDAAPVAEDGPGEVRRVVVAFNRMQDRIRALIADRTQALAAVGHDLRTPLARLRLRSESIGDAETRGAIDHDVTEMEAMITSLLAFLGGESDPELPVRVDLAVMCATLADDVEDRGRSAAYDGPDHLELRLRRSGFKRALTNLVDNALHYGTHVTLALRTDGDVVTLTICDDGPGVPEDKLTEILQPFVRLDPARQRDTVGFGLGLAIVQQAVEAEGGLLTLSNRAEGGLAAKITIERNKI